jgi:antitoxin (DNA-binding transcriptional repressor) of toxin-antitoxin stability system
MTYMTAALAGLPDVPVRQIPIRELQQHAARVIRELAEAEEMAEITNRGMVIARLIPVSPAERAFREMVEMGEIIPAKDPRGLVDLRPLPPRPDGRSLTEEALAMREEERG